MAECTCCYGRKNKPKMIHGQVLSIYNKKTKSGRNSWHFHAQFDLGILIHVNNDLFCDQNKIRHYGEYSDTPLEGTNFGIIHLSIATHPGWSMDNLMVIFSVQSDNHVIETNWKEIRANKKNCVSYKGNVHSKLTVSVSSILSILMENVTKGGTI